MTMTVPPPPPPPPRPNFKIVGGDNVRSLRRIDLAPDLLFDPEQFIGRSIAFLGATRSGKSTTVRRALEQCIKCGIPFTICDIENEYATLKEIGEVIIAGPNVEHGKITTDIYLTNEKQYYTLGRRAYLERKSVILLLGDLDDDTAKLMLCSYLQGLFHAATDPDVRFPYVLAIEEIQEWAPQVGISKDDPLLKTIIRISKRGLKRGINLWPISQRPANVDKNVMTQCSMFFAHSINFTTDMSTYKALFQMADLDARINAFTAGDVLFKDGKTEICARISMPQTKSPSTTPGAVDPARFKAIDVTQMGAEIAAEHDVEGVSIVASAELQALREKASVVDVLQASLNEAVVLQGQLEKRISEMEQQNAAPVVQIVQGDVDVSALQAENTHLKERLLRANARSAPIELLLNLLQSEKGQ